MYSILLIFVFQLTQIIFSAVLAIDLDEPAIDRGYKAKTSDFPNLVKVTVYEVDIFGLETSIETCTGTLIGPSTVITAAHCVTYASSVPSEVTKNFIVRVSNPGDITGSSQKRVWGIVKKGGIKVSNVYVSSTYQNLMDIGDKLEQNAMFHNYNSSAEDSKIAWNAYYDHLDKMTPHDIAFLSLESDVKSMPISKIATIMCRGTQLTPDDTVVLVGFGKAIDTNSFDNSDANPQGNLLYGYSHIAYINDDNSYEIEFENDKTQLANKGDSGSPLFKLLNVKAIYGVLSNGTNNGIASTANTYASTSSPIARKFYGQLIKKPDASHELKKILSTCF